MLDFTSQTQISNMSRNNVEMNRHNAECLCQHPLINKFEPSIVEINIGVLT